MFFNVSIRLKFASVALNSVVNFSCIQILKNKWYSSTMKLQNIVYVSPRMHQVHLAIGKYVLPLEIFQWHVTVRIYSRASCHYCQDTNGSVYLVLYTFTCAKKTSRSLPGRCFPSRITRSVGISANREITRACLAERQTIPLNRPSLLFPLSVCRRFFRTSESNVSTRYHVILIHLLFLSNA